MEKKKQEEEEAYSHIQMDKSSCTRSHTIHYLDLQFSFYSLANIQIKYSEKQTFTE